MSNPSLAVRTTTVTLYQGDDWTLIQSALAEVHAAVQQTVNLRSGDLDAVTEAKSRYNTTADEAEARAVTIELVHLPRKKWRDMVAEHPPRDGNDRDEDNGFNVDTIGDDLVPASVAEGTFTSNAFRDEFIDNLADGDFSKLLWAAIELNQAQGPDPKARLSSQPAPTSHATSNSPER